MCKNRKKDAYEVCFGPNQYDDLLIELMEIEQESYWQEAKFLRVHPLPDNAIFPLFRHGHGGAGGYRPEYQPDVGSRRRDPLSADHGNFRAARFVRLGGTVLSEAGEKSCVFKTGES